MTRYANQTTITPEATRMEIERLLTRYGATGFFFASDGDAAVIGFRMKERMINFVLKLPPAAEFRTTDKGVRRGERAWYNAWDQAKRSHWRALLLIIKAKLEAVECGIVEFEDEFMPQTVMPDGSTVAEWMAPQLAEAYAKGIMPPSMLMLAGPGGAS